MAKNVSFIDKDKELIARIEKYQQDNNIRHFVDESEIYAILL